jgi:hypothetical protein
VYARESAKVCESEWSILPPASSINPKGRAPRGEPSICFYISYNDTYCILHARDAALMPINRQLPHTVGGSIRITGRAAQDFAPRPCVCSDKPVWHYVKSGRPELFMYDKDSIKA